LVQDEEEKNLGGVMKCDKPSIKLKVFLQYTNSLSDKLMEVKKRIIGAFGIDTSNY
jgi:hypothetical protein